MSSYLFVYFTMNEKGDDETIWFSVSRDGLKWTDLGNDKPVLKSELGTKGVRDPFIVYDERLKKYFIIATDLNTNDGRSWYDFSHNGSKAVIVWESEDLISWSDARRIEVGIDGAGCVWAPEAIYCREKKAWFVFWASCVKEQGDDDFKHRIYGSFTNDFVSFTPAFKYIEAEKDIIDTDIIFVDGVYYRFSKDETDKCVTIERSSELFGEFERMRSPETDALEGVEGPLAYYLEKENKWCLQLDYYRVQGGYHPFVCYDITTGNFRLLSDDMYDLGSRKKRHGGVIAISDDEADKLIEHYGTLK